jgi:cellulose synthase/poly-beta-1,6-N-acetylglucosamine synthase-like glycosyltransferase
MQRRGGLFLTYYTYTYLQSVVFYFGNDLSCSVVSLAFCMSTCSITSQFGICILEKELFQGLLHFFLGGLGGARRG